MCFCLNFLKMNKKRKGRLYPAFLNTLKFLVNESRTSGQARPNGTGRLTRYELVNPFKNSRHPDRSGWGTCPTVRRVKPSMRD